MPICELAAFRPSRPDSAFHEAVGLTPHFRAWLDAHGYARFDFARDDLPGGSFGGRRGEGDRLRRRPVIWIHGNADAALGTPHHRHSGWGSSLNHFMAQGYAPRELYALTWGEADMDKALCQYHSRANLTRVRTFIEAVLAYTGADKVDIVGHSMGVTLARKAIKGGPAHDVAAGGAYHLGAPLTDRIGTLVGIAGANHGLALSYAMGPLLPINSPTNGFYPGFAPGLGQSSFLRELNANPAREAERIFSIYSTADEITGPGNLVWGQRTSRIPGQAGEKVFTDHAYGHISIKDRTAAVQYEMIVHGRILA